MLEGELDDHLGYDKHQQSDNANARNGHGRKTIKTGYGEMEIEVPRDREASFNPILVPKRESMVRSQASGVGRGHGVHVRQRNERIRHLGTCKRYLQI